MKKLSLIFKETTEKRVNGYLGNAGSIFVLKYSGLTSSEMSSLRGSLRSAQAVFFVTKNSILRRALKQKGAEAIVNRIEGPCGIVFAKDDPVSVSKTLCDFLKEHDKLKIEGGLLNQKVLEKADIENIARLPSREVLITQVVMMLKSPLRRTVVALNEPLRKLAFCIQQIKDKKSAS